MTLQWIAFCVAPTVTNVFHSLSAVAWLNTLSVLHISHTKPGTIRVCIMLCSTQILPIKIPPRPVAQSSSNHYINYSKFPGSQQTYTAKTQIKNAPAFMDDGRIIKLFSNELYISILLFDLFVLSRRKTKWPRFRYTTGDLFVVSIIYMTSLLCDWVIGS